MIETKIRRVGNSAVVTLSSEALAILDAREGDAVFLVRDDQGGLRIALSEPGLAEALEAAETGMDRYRKAMQDLA